MASPILPSNGFITRLLQQTTPAVPSNQASEAKGTPMKSDQTSISQEARLASKASPNQLLESKLISLYNKRGEKDD